MSEKEKEAVLEEYDIHFADGSNENKSEEEISAELGNPVEIAKETNAVFAMNKAEENRSMKSMFTVLVSVLGLSVINGGFFVIGLFLLLICIPLTLAYLIAVPIAILSPLILIGAGIFKGFDTVSAGDVFDVIRGFSLGSLLAIFGYYAGRYFAKSFVRMVRWHISVYKKEKLI